VRGGEEVFMKTGLLWYDDSKADLAAKVEDAAERYEEKFGRRPNRCYVNPASLPGEGKGFSLDGIKVVTRPSILPNHFWVGIGRPKRT
jgi:hypothetical protein